MNPNEQKAHDIFKEWLRDDTGTEALAPRLSAAGLIVTPLHERALAACEARALHPTIISGGDVTEAEWNRTTAASAECIAVGRESLAAKKPKERFFVRDRCPHPASNSKFRRWAVTDSTAINGSGNKGADVACFVNEAAARAYAAEQNAKEAAR